MDKAAISGNWLKKKRLKNGQRNKIDIFPKKTNEQHLSNYQGGNKKCKGIL